MIIQSFTTWLSAIAPCQRGYAYLDQINEFPTITYTVSERTLSHIGADTRYNILSISLRAYVRGEDPQALCDNLIQSLDERISLFEAHDLGVQDARVIETSSDEGLMAPYGVVDMKLQILYL